MPLGQSGPSVESLEECASANQLLMTMPASKPWHLPLPGWDPQGQLQSSESRGRRGKRIWLGDEQAVHPTGCESDSIPWNLFRFDSVQVPRSLSGFPGQP